MESKFLDVEAVVAIHRIVLDRSPFSDEDPNIFNSDVLESTVNGVCQTMFGELLNPTIYEQAAAYLFGLSNGHPFANGNKRTALIATISFLQMNSYRLTLSQTEAIQLTVDAAAGTISKEDIVEIFRGGGIQLELTGSD